MIKLNKQMKLKHLTVLMSTEENETYQVYLTDEQEQRVKTALQLICSEITIVPKKLEGLELVRDTFYCYDSLEDYLVTHPNKEVSKEAARIVYESTGNYDQLEQQLRTVPESQEYYDYLELNKS